MKGSYFSYDAFSGMRIRYRKAHAFSSQQQLPVCRTLNAPFSTLERNVFFT